MAAMTEKDVQAFKRLLKRLSALRAALRKDERALLDSIVLGVAPEVEAHAMLGPHGIKAVTPRIGIEYDAAKGAYRLMSITPSITP